MGAAPVPAARAPSPLLLVKELAKDFPGVRALDGVSLAIFPGEVHALVGENGAGKSTLIKVLAGVYPAGHYQGEVLLDGAAARFRSSRDAEAGGVRVIHQELANVPFMSVAENVFLGAMPTRFGLVDFERMKLEAEAALARLGVVVDAGLEMVRLGVGMRQMVEIARAVRAETRALILDEPTAALAEHEVERLLEILRGLKAEGVAIVYVSHKLDEVFALADRITVLRDGRTVGTGRVDEWDRAGLVRAMVGREVRDLYPRSERSFGKVVLQVRGLGLDDPHLPGRARLADIGFEVRAGEVLGVAGLMGAGRTELLKTIFGAFPGHGWGEVWVDGARVGRSGPGDAIEAGLALVPEDRKTEGLCLIFSIVANLSMASLKDFSRFGVLNQSAERRRCGAVAAELGVKAASLEAAVETLSGGNQQKVALGKWLTRAPRALLLDEPTRGIDVAAKAEVHRLIDGLAGRGMAVVLASSELPELLAVSDRVLVLKEGRMTALFERSEATPERVMEAAT